MLTAALSALSALIAVLAAVYCWIQSYDNQLRLDKIERGYSSLNSRLGKLKQDAVKEAKEVAREAAGDAAAAQQCGGGGMDMMEKMLPLFMGQMNAGGDGQPRNTPDEPPEQEDPNLIGQGGTD